MIHPDHLRRVIRETLPSNLYSEAAENLIMGTIATESVVFSRGLFRMCLWQLGRSPEVAGPAVGIGQMEPGTFAWLQSQYGHRYEFADRRFEELAWDLRLAILLVRVRYLPDPEPLPSPSDLEAQGRYYKRVYNTSSGKGSAEKYVRDYKRFVE